MKKEKNNFVKNRKTNKKNRSVKNCLIALGVGLSFSAALFFLFQYLISLSAYAAWSPIGYFLVSLPTVAIGGGALIANSLKSSSDNKDNKFIKENKHPGLTDIEDKKIEKELGAKVSQEELEVIKEKAQNSIVEENRKKELEKIKEFHKISSLSDEISNTQKIDITRSSKIDLDHVEDVIKKLQEQKVKLEEAKSQSFSGDNEEPKVIPADSFRDTKHR